MQEFISLAVGVLMPLVISFLKSRTWPDAVKVLLSLLCCVIAGACVAYATGGLTWGAWAADAGLVFTAATVVYKAWFKATALDRQLTETKVLS